MDREQVELIRKLVDKMPTFDLSWPQEMEDQWIDWCGRLLAALDASQVRRQALEDAAKHLGDIAAQKRSETSREYIKACGRAIPAPQPQQEVGGG